MPRLVTCTYSRADSKTYQLQKGLRVEGLVVALQADIKADKDDNFPSLEAVYILNQQKIYSKNVVQGIPHASVANGDLPYSRVATHLQRGTASI